MAGRLFDWVLTPSEDGESATISFKRCERDPVWWPYPGRTLELWFVGRRLVWSEDDWSELSDLTFRISGTPTVKE